MLYQDTLTGMLHEVPDAQVYGLGYADDPYGVGEGQILYDGLGNPVGAWPFSNILKSVGGLVQKALPMATSMLGPYGQILNRALPAISQFLSPGASGAPAQPAPPGMAAAMAPGYPGGPMPMPFRPPMPAGWVRPQLPYTGLGPRRLYMRCAVWPGPRGLVPAIAAQAAAAPAQAAAAAAAQTAAAMMHHRRRGHRRR